MKSNGEKNTWYRKRYRYEVTMRRLLTTCYTERTLRIISGRWKILILWLLFHEVLRFSELARLLREVTDVVITKRMLTRQLRELEEDGVVIRKVYPQVPPKVEYSLTALGKSLRHVIDAMDDWGQLHDATLKESSRRLASDATTIRVPLV
jgi:DNA-binding HxlR family transcriptional regulator